MPLIWKEALILGIVWIKNITIIFHCFCCAEEHIQVRRSVQKLLNMLKLEDVDWIQVAQDRIKLRAITDMEINLLPWKRAISWTPERLTASQEVLRQIKLVVFKYSEIHFTNAAVRLAQTKSQSLKFLNL